MQMCICGWYWRYDLHQTLSRLGGEHEDIWVIANGAPGDGNDILHFAGDNLLRGVKIVFRENSSLEWGAYNYFLKYFYDWDSDVLFCHDDTAINEDAREESVEIFEEIRDIRLNIRYDFAYIFGSEAEMINNRGRHPYGRHGRSFFASAEFLRELGDFPTPEIDAADPHQLNNGILAFDERLREIQERRPDLNLINTYILKGWINGRRGVLPND